MSYIYDLALPFYLVVISPDEKRTKLNFNNFLRISKIVFHLRVCNIFSSYKFYVPSKFTYNNHVLQNVRKHQDLDSTCHKQNLDSICHKQDLDFVHHKLNAFNNNTCSVCHTIPSPLPINTVWC